MHRDVEAGAQHMASFPRVLLTFRLKPSRRSQASSLRDLIFELKPEPIVDMSLGEPTADASTVDVDRVVSQVDGTAPQVILCFPQDCIAEHIVDVLVKVLKGGNLGCD